MKMHYIIFWKEKSIISGVINLFLGHIVLSFKLLLLYQSNPKTKQIAEKFIGLVLLLISVPRQKGKLMESIMCEVQMHM